MENNFRKEYRYIHIYVEPNHFAVHLKLIKYCKSTILQLKFLKKPKEVWKLLIL